jgi:hypothetical protein
MQIGDASIDWNNAAWKRGDQGPFSYATFSNKVLSWTLNPRSSSDNHPPSKLYRYDDYSLIMYSYASNAGNGMYLMGQDSWKVKVEGLTPGTVKVVNNTWVQFYNKGYSSDDGNNPTFYYFNSTPDQTFPGQDPTNLEACLSSCSANDGCMGVTIDRITGRCAQKSNNCLEKRGPGGAWGGAGTPQLWYGKTKYGSRYCDTGSCSGAACSSPHYDPNSVAAHPGA